MDKLNQTALKLQIVLSLGTILGVSACAEVHAHKPKNQHIMLDHFKKLHENNRIFCSEPVGENSCIAVSRLIHADNNTLRMSTESYMIPSTNITVEANISWNGDELCVKDQTTTDMRFFYNLKGTNQFLSGTRVEVSNELSLEFKNRLWPHVQGLCFQHRISTNHPYRYVGLITRTSRGGVLNEITSFGIFLPKDARPIIREDKR